MRVVVACVCLVAVVVGLLVNRQRKRGSEVLASSEDAQPENTLGSFEVTNPLCKCLNPSFVCVCFLCFLWVFWSVDSVSLLQTLALVSTHLLSSSMSVTAATAGARPMMVSKLSMLLHRLSPLKLAPAAI